MTRKQELAKIAREIKTIKSQLKQANNINHFDVHGYFDTVEEYLAAEDIIFKSGLLWENYNYNDSGSETGSFSYNVLAKNRKKLEKLIERKLKGEIVSTKAFDKGGVEIEYWED